MPAAASPPRTDEATGENSALGKHPLPVGSRARCLRGEGTHGCEIIERRCVDGDAGAGGAAAWSYYVHYDGLNRRLDEWVPADRLQLNDEPAPKATLKRAGEPARDLQERLLVDGKVELPTVDPVVNIVAAARLRAQA